jgi:hypothetical protein
MAFYYPIEPKCFKEIEYVFHLGPTIIQFDDPNNNDYENQIFIFIYIYLEFVDHFVIETCSECFIDGHLLVLYYLVYPKHFKDLAHAYFTMDLIEC